MKDYYGIDGNKTSPKHPTGEQNHQEIMKKDAILKITEYERRIFEKKSMTSLTEKETKRKIRNYFL